MAKKSAKKKTKKTRKARSPEKKAGRGRKPGAWTLISPQELAAYRGKHGISVNALARHIGRTGSAVGQWLRGVGAPSEEFQRHIMERLNLPPGSPTPYDGVGSASRASRRASKSSALPDELEQTGARLQELAREWRLALSAMSKLLGQ